MVIGAVAGAVCFYGATSLKRRFGYDDALDAFGVHGIGGFIGSVLTGVFAANAAGGTEAIAIGRQVGVQLLACAATILWSGLATAVIIKVVDATVGIRVDEEKETVGLDLSDHEERGYDY